jgi:hypothetical protein
MANRPPNMFRAGSYNLDDNRKKVNANKHGQYKDSVNLGGNYNVNLAHFFFLPKFDKTEAEQILAEIQKDSES